MTTTISMLAIDLGKGGFQVCAVGPDGSVLYNRVLSRNRFAAAARPGRAIDEEQATGTSKFKAGTLRPGA